MGTRGSAAAAGANKVAKSGDEVGAGADGANNALKSVTIAPLAENDRQRQARKSRQMPLLPLGY